MTYADTDPCPGASRVGRLDAWQHGHAVACSGCGMVGAFRWWSSERGHECGRCRRRRAALEAEGS